MNQTNRRAKSSAANRRSYGDPKERKVSHLQQSPAPAKANGHAVYPLVRNRTIQNAQVGRASTDYDRRQIPNDGPNTGAALAPLQPTWGPGTESYTHSNAALYTGTPPSGHVARNAVTQLPVYESPRQSRHTRKASYTKHSVASPVTNITNISSPLLSIHSPTATRGRIQRTTATTDTPSLLFSSNQPSSFPTSTMDNNTYWPEPSLNGHSALPYGTIDSVTSGPGLAHMPNQYSHDPELYNYDGTCPPAYTGSERMPRALPASTRPGGKIDAANIVFLSPGSSSLPASSDDQRPVASVPEAPHTNAGNVSHTDPYAQFYIGPQTYRTINPGSYYPDSSTFDPMSTQLSIHPRTEHVHQPYIQHNYEGTTQLVPSYYGQPPQSPTPSRSPTQHRRQSQVMFSPYTLPGSTYVNVPAYQNDLMPTAELHALIDAQQKNFMAVPSSTNNGILGSPLHTSPSEPPSDLERPQPSPALKNAARFPGQRLDVDQQLLDTSFCGADEDSRKRRAILNDIQCQPWYHYHDQEPRIESLSDPTARGLGMVGRSIYTVFLAQDESGSHWRCLFGGHGAHCDRSTKQFERVERAIEHVRRHLGHRPYACDDACLKSQTSGAPCGQRFFASQYLQDHKRRPQKRKSTAQP